MLKKLFITLVLLILCLPISSFADYEGTSQEELVNIVLHSDIYNWTLDGVAPSFGFNECYLKEGIKYSDVFNNNYFRSKFVISIEDEGTGDYYVVFAGIFKESTALSFKFCVSVDPSLYSLDEICLSTGNGIITLSNRRSPYGPDYLTDIGIIKDNRYLYIQYSFITILHELAPELFNEYRIDDESQYDWSDDSFDNYSMENYD